MTGASIFLDTNILIRANIATAPLHKEVLSAFEKLQGTEGWVMTITELLDELNKLSRAEKLRVIQYLAHELEAEETITFAGEYEVWSPQDEGGAVATLHKLLEEDRRNNAE